jgi:hypothetical protein
VDFERGEFLLGVCEVVWVLKAVCVERVGGEEVEAGLVEGVDPGFEVVLGDVDCLGGGVGSTQVGTDSILLGLEESV